MPTTTEFRDEQSSEVKQPQSVPTPAGQSGRSSPTSYRAWVAKAAKQPMVLETVDLGPLADEDVEVAVEHCGLCHSDLSVFNNDWGNSQFPAILGHEVVGRITAVGPNAKGLEVGQRAGIGWNSGSCMHCRQCMSGSHHLCPQVQPTIVGHRGGFATHIRSHWAWAFPLPEKLNFAEAGPLLCGGVTVFSPLVTHAKPTQRVGIIGIGGLGHMAVKFAAAYGCDVTAFTSRGAKADEAKRFGANQVITSDDAAAIKKLAGSLRSPDQHCQREARLGRDHRHACAERPPACRRGSVGTHPCCRLLPHHATAQHFGFAEWLAGNDRHDARLCRTAQYCAGDRALPHEQNQRSLRQTRIG